VIAVVQQPADTIRRYLQNRDIAERSVPASSALSRRARSMIPYTFRPSLKIASTWSVMLISVWYAYKLIRRGEEIRLHVGCGATRLDNWVNVDLTGSRADLFWDLRCRLPFPNDSIAAIFHEHMLEHLPLSKALSFTQECWQLLRPGGVLRIGVPDFGRYAQSYAYDSRFIDMLRPGRPTPLLAVTEIVYLSGHQSVWDAPTLLLMLREIGFCKVKVRKYGESVLQPPPDSEHRRMETLYVEAIK
jgi:predicted SAM-dependent methyltransferase